MFRSLELMEALQSSLNLNNTHLKPPPNNFLLKPTLHNFHLTLTLISCLCLSKSHRSSINSLKWIWMIWILLRKNLNPLLLPNQPMKCRERVLSTNAGSRFANITETGIWQLSKTGKLSYWLNAKSKKASHSKPKNNCWRKGAKLKKNCLRWRV